jgi:hypothetical protein
VFDGPAVLQSPDTEDGTLVNHTALNTKNVTMMWTPIISPSKGIQSNAISKEDNGNCLLPPLKVWFKWMSLTMVTLELPSVIVVHLRD